jgi:hypothetical protein
VKRGESQGLVQVFVSLGGTGQRTQLRDDRHEKGAKAIYFDCHEFNDVNAVLNPSQRKATLITR